MKYYHTHRPNTRFNGSCIIENETHWQREGTITHTSAIPGLLGIITGHRQEQNSPIQGA